MGNPPCHGPFDDNFESEDDHKLMGRGDIAYYAFGALCPGVGRPANITDEPYTVHIRLGEALPDGSFRQWGQWMADEDPIGLTAIPQIGTSLPELQTQELAIAEAALSRDADDHQGLMLICVAAGAARDFCQAIEQTVLAFAELLVSRRLQARAAQGLSLAFDDEPGSSDQAATATTA